MSLTKSITSLFDNLFKIADNNQFSPEENKKFLGVEMESPEKSPHAQIAEELIAIQQRNSKGFKVIDINPMSLPPEDYGCQLQLQDMIDLLGPEFVNTTGGNFEDLNGSISMPYWRTVELPYNGNFLKVEYLPIRSNDIASAFYQQEIFVKDNTTVESGTTSDSFEIFSPKHSSDRVLLVNFQDVGDKSIIVKNDRVFKTEFTSVFISFKQFSPRIRITIGYNSSIEDIGHADDLANLHSAGGWGLKDNLYQNLVPFCITNRDLNLIQSPTGLLVYNPTATNYNSADLITNIPNMTDYCLNPGGTITDYQVAQYTNNSIYSNAASQAACVGGGGVWVPTNFEKNGLICGFITEIDASFFLESMLAQPDSFMAHFILEIVDYNLGTQASIVRRLCDISVPLSCVGGGSDRNHKAKVFTHPVRYTLRPSQALRALLLRDVVPTGGAGVGKINCAFSVHGYSIGALSGYGVNGGFAVAPFTSMMKLTEHPFPYDMAISNNPRR